MAMKPYGSSNSDRSFVQLKGVMSVAYRSPSSGTKAMRLVENAVDAMDVLDDRLERTAADISLSPQGKAQRLKEPVRIVLLALKEVFADVTALQAERDATETKLLALPVPETVIEQLADWELRTRFNVLDAQGRQVAMADPRVRLALARDPLADPRTNPQAVAAREKHQETVRQEHRAKFEELATAKEDISRAKVALFVFRSAVEHVAQQYGFGELVQQVFPIAPTTDLEREQRAAAERAAAEKAAA